MVLRHSKIAVINIACQEADTASLTEARHAIGQARDTREEACTDDDVGGIFAYVRVRLANYSAGSFSKQASQMRRCRPPMPRTLLLGEE